MVKLSEIIGCLEFIISLFLIPYLIAKNQLKFSKNFFLFIFLGFVFYFFACSLGLVSFLNHFNLNLYSYFYIVAAPLVEEWFFRREFYKKFSNKYLFFIFSTFSFVLWHHDFRTKRLILLSLFSLTQCHIYSKTESLGNVVIIHSVYNLLISFS